MIKNFNLTNKIGIATLNHNDFKVLKISDLICCDNPSQTNLHEFRYELVDGRYLKIPFLNRVCTRCYTHWYGNPDSLKKYSKKEWDEMIAYVL